MAHLLGGEALCLRYPTQVVFDGVTVGVNDGDRIGIVGRNGEGKSSLLGMLTGCIEPDSGRVTRRGGVQVAALDQSDTLDPAESVGSALVGERPDHEWAGDARVRDVVAGLVSDLDWAAPIGSLSGGQRRRVQLAQLLIGDWDVIALDEPTNHLDVEGITWLAAHLKQRWAPNVAGLLVVTHDRWFLDEVATTTWEVHGGAAGGVVEPFDGGYAAYVLQRVERDRIAAASRSQAAEPDAQGAGLAAQGRPGPHLQTEVPHRCGQSADRRHPSDPKHRRIGQAGDLSTGQGRHRPSRRIGVIRQTRSA